MKSFSMKQIFKIAFKFFSILFRKYVCKKRKQEQHPLKGGNETMDDKRTQHDIELCMKTPLCKQCVKYRVCLREDEDSDVSTSNGGSDNDSKSNSVSEDAD